MHGRIKMQNTHNVIKPPLEDKQSINLIIVTENDGLLRQIQESR